MGRDLFKYIISAGFIVILMLIPLLITSGYVLRFLFLLFLYVSLASSWNILGGYAGQICLGIGAFFGIGAYITALSLLQGLPFLMSLFLGCVGSLSLALILTPIFKLRGVYFSMGTLFLPEILKSLVLNLRDITGGAKGVILPISVPYHSAFCYIYSLILALFTLFVSYVISKSRFRLAFEAIREDQDAAVAVGVNPLKFKLFAFAICSSISGIAGGIYAFNMVYLEPYGTFDIMWSIIPVFICIIGGVGTLLGPIIGATVYMFLSQAIASSMGEMNLLILGGLLIIVITFMPTGIVTILKRLYKK